MCSVPYGSPPQLRQTKFSLLCTKRQDQQFSGEIDLICSLLPGWRIWKFPQKGLDFLNTLSSLLVTCCLGGIIANFTKILRVLSWNFNSSISKTEYFWQHHLLRWIASFYRKRSCSVLLPQPLVFLSCFPVQHLLSSLAHLKSLISSWGPGIYTQQVPFHIRNYPSESDQ